MPRTGFSVYALLERAHAMAHRVATDLLREVGVGPTEAWVLEAIESGSDICATGIARLMEVPTSTVTRALHRMERCGYLVLLRGIEPDIRLMRPRLTRIGARIRQVSADFETECDRLLLSEATPSNYPELLHGLSHIERAGRKAAPMPLYLRIPREIEL